MNSFGLTYIAKVTETLLSQKLFVSANKNWESSFNVISKSWLHWLLVMLQMILIINRLSLFLGDCRFIEEKSYWMHVQNDKFMWQRDECIRQMPKIHQITKKCSKCKIHGWWIKDAFRNNHYLHYIHSLLSNIGHYFFNHFKHVILMPHLSRATVP